MFVWDETKKIKVIEHHKIDFEKIFDIFDDPFTHDFEDCDHSDKTEIR